MIWESEEEREREREKKKERKRWVCGYCADVQKVFGDVPDRYISV